MAVSQSAAWEVGGPARTSGGGVGRGVRHQEPIGVEEAANVLSWSQGADEQDMPVVRPRLTRSPIWRPVVADGDPVGRNTESALDLRSGEV